ncbi:MAG: tRNA uridine-5-carboxymethylaminomethyl(34) synthesis GTPase MnmE [Candidatus Omnitrophica bacterium]|nr:tRNA uridine-5-carboxymethylaminomethyl(34) synthesis GTPase MnmE [Candidatus Omnitrophota bacterium]
MKRDVFDYLEDTIVAIATPSGRGAIGIVRMSGKGACDIAAKVFCPKGKSRIPDLERRGVIPGFIVAPSFESARAVDAAGQKHAEMPPGTVDEVVLIVMKAPRSYTGEDMVEVNCHGGPVVVRKILDLLVRYGARIAEPGEFTRRAFLNGKIDLVQAEAVADIVDARTDAALSLAMSHLTGALSEKIKTIHTHLLQILSHIEALIDFPDEEIAEFEYDRTGEELHGIIGGLDELIVGFDTAIKVKQGLCVAIYGRRNVGKSSLLNALLKSERAIVAPAAGTTRDIITEETFLRGIPLTLCDTAGFGASGDFIEREGMVRAGNLLRQADLLLLVVDGAASLEEEDRSLLKNHAEKERIIVLNKIDLPRKISGGDLRGYAGKAEIVEVSAREGTQIDILEEVIVRTLSDNAVTANGGTVLISNVRHRELLRQTYQGLLKALEHLAAGFSIEFVADDIKNAAEYIDDILGTSATDEVLNLIFERFCVGK